ncbi:MAG: outer membrane beta-barrel protein [Bacteroidota bacterium]
MYRFGPMFILLFSASLVSAQNLKLGVLGGITLSDQRIENEGLDFLNIDYDTRPRISWEVGLTLDVVLISNLSIQPALLLTNKGYVLKDGDSGFGFDIRAKPLYVHLPVPLKYSFDVGDIRLFGGTGLYMGLGVGGDIEVSGGSGDFSFLNRDDIEWGNDGSDTYRTFDSGFLFMGGGEVGDIQFSLNYELGLRNISTDDNGDNTIRNRSFHIRFVYFVPL